LINRRKGFNFELQHDEHLLDREGKIIVEYVWKAVAGTGNINFVVTQIGSEIFFYEVDPSGALSPGLKSFSIDLSDYVMAGAPSPSEIAAQFASGKGYLFVVHPYCDPFYVAYSPSADTITVTQYELEIRDVKGATEDPSLAVDERPTSLSTTHQYNLFNQGW